MTLVASALAWLLAAAGLLAPAVPAGSPSLIPVPVGRGADFRPPAAPLEGAVIAGMGCRPVDGVRDPVHVEVFARGRVVIVPAGIGIAGPLERRGAYAFGGRCRYPLVTVEPTGVVWVSDGAGATLGELFALWGRPLRRDGVLGFPGRVRVTIDGAAYHGDPAQAPLRPRSQVVVQVGARVPPHPDYRFGDER
jgi:hypothetical protein